MCPAQFIHRPQMNNYCYHSLAELQTKQKQKKRKKNNNSDGDDDGEWSAQIIMASYL